MAASEARAELMPDGLPLGGRDSPLGGQAVIEGVMMRGRRGWAVAIRRRDGRIEVTAEDFVPWVERRAAFRLPVVRGVVALAESLRLGARAMSISTDAHLAPGEGEQLSGWAWAVTLIGALAIAIGVFFVLPVVLTGLIRDQLGSAWLFWLVEGVLRVAIFIGYIVALTRLRDLHRVFQYHGAEHKSISCYEAGEELTPENVARFSRLHPRCGTSFLLVVMVLAIFVLAPIGLPAWYWLVASRVLGIPLIAGLAYEAIKLAGRGRHHAWVRALMWPGLMLQNLTTAEPEREHLEVAIAALEAVRRSEVETSAPSNASLGVRGTSVVPGRQTSSSDS